MRIISMNRIVTVSAVLAVLMTVLLSGCGDDSIVYDEYKLTITNAENKVVFTHTITHYSNLDNGVEWSNYNDGSSGMANVGPGCSVNSKLIATSDEVYSRNRKVKLKE